jgi:hypothetical protein
MNELHTCGVCGIQYFDIFEGSTEIHCPDCSKLEKPERSACDELRDMLFVNDYHNDSDFWLDISIFSEKYETKLKQIPAKE